MSRIDAILERLGGLYPRTIDLSLDRASEIPKIGCRLSFMLQARTGKAQQSRSCVPALKRLDTGFTSTPRRISSGSPSVSDWPGG